jgi:hypothetical protein
MRIEASRRAFGRIRGVMELHNVSNLLRYDVDRNKFKRATPKHIFPQVVVLSDADLAPDLTVAIATTISHQI